ncbi:IPTL-CTERM sorting domain-containing protein [Brevundimonas sp. M1A4_2e]
MRCSGLLFAGLLSVAATTAAAQSADLAVTITDFRSQRLSGGFSDYSITVSNLGPDAASNVVLTNALPSTLARLNLDSPAYGTCSAGAYNVPGETIVCNIPTLAAGQTAYFRFETLLSGSATGTVSNTVTVSSDTPDPNPADNAATDTDIIVGAPAAVPTLTEWALILFGSLLAGGAALHLHRGRQAA